MASANDLAGFKFLFESGAAETLDGLFSMTVEFGDISYEDERKDVKDAIYDQMLELHNGFTAGDLYQITLANIPRPEHGGDRSLVEQGPNSALAAAMNDLVEERRRAGRTEFDRRNFVSFAVAAESLDAALPALTATAESVGAKMNRIGVRARPLGGAERAELLSDLVKGPGGRVPVDYRRLSSTKREHVRDLVAPAWALYDEGERFLKRYLTLPGRAVETIQIRDFGSDLSDRALRSIRALPIPMVISLLYDPQPVKKVRERIRRNIDNVQASMNSYASAQARHGADNTLMPPAMEERESDARELLDFLKDNDVQIAWMQALITVSAPNAETLSEYVGMVLAECGAWALEAVRMPCLQEEAFVSALPLSTPRLERRWRSITSAEAAALIPFSSQNISDDPHTSYMLGVDRISGRTIFVDPKRTKSPHMWVFGMTGAGKGMEIKSMLTYLLLQHPRNVLDERTGEWAVGDPSRPQVFIFDFHNEYGPTAKEFDAAISWFGPSHESCLNPMDLSDSRGALTFADVRDNTDYFIALMESVMGRPMTQREKSLLDRCLISVYEPLVGTDERPVLHDLYAALRAEDGPVARELADSLEMYVEGSMNSFAGETNVRESDLLNVYVMSDLGQTMQTLGMMSALQHVRVQTYRNYAAGRPTILLLEEIQILFDNDAAVRMIEGFFSELRKFGLQIISITQLPERVLQHPRARNFFELSSMFVFLPNQEANAQLISDIFKLSSAQTDRIRPTAQAGTGLVVVDGVKIAFTNVFERHGTLYDLWNTDPDKMAKEP